MYVGQVDEFEVEPLGVDVICCAFFIDSMECELRENEAFRLLVVPTFNFAISSNRVMFESS